MQDRKDSNTLGSLERFDLRPDKRLNSKDNLNRWGSEGLSALSEDSPRHRSQVSKATGRAVMGALHSSDFAPLQVRAQ